MSTVMNKRIFLSPPHMGAKEMDYILEAFNSNWIAPLGPQVDQFEREVAGFTGSAGAVALSSGTAAIHLALRLLQVGPGDQVFCSTLTFVASANPVLYLGAEPVFVDSEPESWNMSPIALKRAFQDAARSGKMPKAVIIVNLYGQSANMDQLMEICNHYDVPVVEDAAESLGAAYKGKASGTFGKFGVFSFNGNKIITTSGGGMLCSDDLEALEKARFWAAQAREAERHYQHKELGYNYRLSNILAAIGRGQLRVLNDRIRAKRAVFEKYREALGKIGGFGFMPEMPCGYSTRWLTVMTVDETKCGITPADIVDYLAECNIEARPVWKPMHLQPLFEKYPYYPHDFENSISDMLFGQGVCLPSGSGMTGEEQNRVIQAVTMLWERSNKSKTGCERVLL